MKFALLIYGDESGWSALDEAGRAEMYAQHEAFGKWLAERGWDRGGEELRSSDRAATVRADGGDFLVSDGPFVETKEQLGGFYVIECGSRDEAIEAAKQLPGGVVEVREIVED
ncbi:MAG: YciI family protein [Actinomycetota bacterium]